MKKQTLFALWGGMFVLCGGLGLIPEPEGLLRWVCTGAAMLFFLPPALLLRTGDKNTAKRIRDLAVASLSLTVALLIVNFAAFAAPEAVGDLLHVLLAIVSAPMLCAGSWLISLFGWACLLVAALS